MNSLDLVLADVDWASLEGAYGPATEAPQMIRELMSEEPQRRAAAADALREHFNHQGSLYAATVAIVKPLLNLVRDPQFLGRAEVLDLLSGFSRGVGMYTAHQSLAIFRDMHGPEKMRRMCALEKQWQDDIHAQLLTLRDDLRLWSQTENDAVRQSAKDLLAQLTGQP